MEIISVGNGDIQLDEYAWPSIALLAFTSHGRNGRKMYILTFRKN